MNDSSVIARTTGTRAVIPFYIYASLSFFAACVLLALHANETQGHYFQPVILSIVHTLALGWGTMMILGAGHQLIPVIAECSLFSEPLAILSFLLAGTGIVLLVSGFYRFSFDWITITGALLVNMAVICYLVNFSMTVSRSTRPNVQTVFMFTGALWLLITVLAGLVLLLNFNTNILPQNSIDYLGWHAHMGIAGWFLLTIIGASARLVPMFLLSEYESNWLLWVVYALINIGLIFLSFNEILGMNLSNVIALSMVGVALALYVFFILKVFRNRIRKRMDNQMKVTLGSFIMTFVPALIMGCILVIHEDVVPIAKVYGFIIFFGWITAIIIAMTFKTLPFIIWNKLYGGQALPQGQPADLFNHKVFLLMTSIYLAGFATSLAGMIGEWIYVLATGSVMMVLASLIYNYQTFQLIFAKRK